MRGSTSPARMACSSFTSSALVFLSWKLTPQKASLGTSSSTATPIGVPSADLRTETTRARNDSWVSRLVSSISLPTLGSVFISRRPPSAFTSTACAFALTLLPAAFCHFASRGTTTGKRTPRRRSSRRGEGLSVEDSMTLDLQSWSASLYHCAFAFAGTVDFTEGWSRGRRRRGHIRRHG